MKTRTNIRAVSPLRISKFNGNANLKPDPSQQNVDIQNVEVTSEDYFCEHQHHDWTLKFQIPFL